MLSVSGYEVEAAGDGKGALDRALTGHLDAVVMDLGLPDGDALDVIQRIRAEDAQVIIIAFSGWEDLEAAARTAGADALVLKPDSDVLAASLDDLTSRP